MLLNSQFYDNTRIQGFAVLEQTNTGDKSRQFAPLKMTLLEGEVSGPVADLFLTQIFAFQREEIEKEGSIEAIYRFPLPGDAAVTEVLVTFGDVEIRTALLPRKQAEDEYKEARDTHRQAVLLTRESPDVFTLSVNGIKSGEEVRIRTRFVVAGTPNQTGFSFRIPLTTAPRYVREDEIHTRHAQGNPLLTIQDPLHRFSIKLRSLGAGSLESLTHEISLRDGQYLLTSGEMIPNKDFELIYRPEPQMDQISCQIFSSGGDDPCLLALVTPPIEQKPRIPLDVIVLVDHSGSMNGGKKVAADRAVELFLSRLSPDDRFNLCLFESDQYWFAENPVPAHLRNRENAIEFLKDDRSGGTQLGVTIEQALYQDRSPYPVSRHLLIITDAEVSDFGRIISLIDEESERSDKRRCSVICIDSSPNALLVRRITDKTGGVCLYLTNASGEGDITDAISDILSSWEHIVAEGVSLSINSSRIITRGRSNSLQEGFSHIEIPPVGVSRSSWIMLKAFHGSDPLTCSLHLPDGTEIPSETHESPVIRSLIGAWIIQELEFLMHSHPAEDTVHKKLSELGITKFPDGGNIQASVYADNTSKFLRKKITGIIEKTSLEYGIASSETAFFASRTERGTPTGLHVIVPSALPEGWSSEFNAKPAIRARLSPDVSRINPRRIPGCDLASGPDIFYFGGSGSSGSGGYASSPDMFSFRDTNRSAPEELITVATAPLSRGRDQKGSRRISIFNGSPVFHEHRAVLYDSEDQTDDSDCIMQGTISDIVFRISGEDYVPSQTFKVMIEIFEGTNTTPIESLPLRNFIRLGRYSWPEPDLIRSRHIRVVLYDPQGVSEKWLISLELVIEVPGDN